MVEIMLPTKAGQDEIKGIINQILNMALISEKAIFDIPGSRSWTVPEGVSKIYITASGAGGGGGAGAGSGSEGDPSFNGTSGGATSFGSHLTLHGGSGGYGGSFTNQSLGRPSVGIGGGFSSDNILGYIKKGYNGKSPAYQASSNSNRPPGGDGGGESDNFPDIYSEVNFSTPIAEGSDNSIANNGNSYGGGGAGGAGTTYGSSTYNYKFGGAGGGSGAKCFKVPILVTPNEVINIVVGKGGKGGSRTNASSGGTGADGILIIEW